MRIALVSQEYPPETAKGGLGSQTYLKAHGLAALGHQVHVISRTHDAQRHHRMDGRVKVTRIPAFSTRLHVYEPAVDWLTYSAEVAAALEALHWHTPLDVVDFPEWACEGYIHLLNQCEWNRVPSVIHLHGPLAMLAHTIGWPELESRLYQVGTEMEGACLRLADAVFASSRCSAEWCVRHYGLKADAIPVLHTGVDTELFAPRDGPKSARPTVIFVGKLARNKGVFELLEACALLTREFPDLQLRVLGRAEPNLAHALQDRAKELDQSALLELAGFVDRPALPDQLSRAHVFAAPSRYEGGPGFVYLEAMACGLPVIACEGSGAAEVVRPGENGLLVPPENTEALTVALRSLLKDAALRQRLGECARRFVLTEADSRACLKKLESFYAAVAAGKAACAADVTASRLGPLPRR